MVWNREQCVATIVGLCFFFTTHVGGAGTLPDAGGTLRDMEKSVPVPPAPPAAGVNIEQKQHPTPQVSESIKFTIKSFHITGNSVFTQQELLGLVQEFTGKERGLADVEKAAASITEHYHARGYLVARAYIPAQKINNGEIRIAVLEGRYEQVDIKNKSRIHDSVLKRFLTPGQIGDVIDVSRLDQALTLLQDTTQPSQMSGVLRPGKAAGTSDLVVHFGETPLVTGRLDADVFGTRLTGRYRMGGAVQLNSPTGYGDRLEARILTSGRGQDYGRLAYNLPVGGQGLRLGAGYTESRYRIGEEFSALDAYGRAVVWSANASYPFMGSKRFNLYGSASFDRKRLDDHVDATLTDTNKQADVLTVGVNGAHYAASGAATTFVLQLGAGDLHISTPAAKATDAASARTQGRYDKLGYTVTHYQPIVENTLLYLSLTGQRASKNLDSVEKFSLGGPYGVRAYPVGEAAGDDGYLATVELRYGVSQPVLTGKLTLIGFLDTGATRIDHTQFSATDADQRLSDTGVGFALGQPGNFDVNFSYAWKLGDAKAVSDTDKSGRAWVQLSKMF